MAKAISIPKSETHPVHYLKSIFFESGGVLSTTVDEADIATLLISPEEVSIPSDYKGASLIRTRTPLGPYSRAMPRDPWWSQEVGVCA